MPAQPVLGSTGSEHDGPGDTFCFCHLLKVQLSGGFAMTAPLFPFLKLPNY